MWPASQAENIDFDDSAHNKEENRQKHFNHADRYSRIEWTEGTYHTDYLVSGGTDGTRYVYSMDVDNEGFSKC